MQLLAALVAFGQQRNAGLSDGQQGHAQCPLVSLSFFA